MLPSASTSAISRGAFLPPELVDAPVIHDLYQLAVDSCAPNGLYMEFGVATGKSLRELRRIIPKDITLYGFDSFGGLPEVWQNLPVGTFATSFRIRLPNTVLIEGFFEETVPEFTSEYDGHVNLMHIDCDLYGSTKTVLNGFKDRIIPGTVILFDELFGYEGYEAHEYRALREFISETGKTFNVIGRWDAFRVAIQFL